MPSFVVSKKTFDLNSSNGASFLVSRQSREQETLTANCLMTPLKRTFEMPLQYALNQTNGQALSSFQSTFPSGKYDALTAEPVWLGHRFVGWFPTNEAPSQAAPSTAGIMTSESSTSCEVLTAFAHWQLPIQIQFDATTNGGQMPSGWSAPYYYIGQQLQVLPQPTHSTMNFDGWFTATTGGTKVTAATIATASMNNVTLFAQYVNTTYELPNLGDDWELNIGLNPDPTAYDGCYQSFSNVGVDNSDAILTIHTIGYSTFKFYLRSYAESTYDYCYCECSTGSVVSEQEKSADELYYEQKKAEYEAQGYYVECYNDYDNWYSWSVYDQDWNWIDGGSFQSGGDPSSTQGKQNSETSINGYQLVTYQFNDPAENYIYVHYIKDGSAADGDDRGYVLIPYDQN